MNSEALTPAYSLLEHQPIEVTTLVHGVVRTELMHDAAVVSRRSVAQHPVAMAPLEHYAPHQVGDLSDLGGIVLAGSPADFGKRIAVEPEKWATVIRTGHFKPQ